MSENRNQNPEQIARDKIDQMLVEAGWVVQSNKKGNVRAAKGVAIREYATNAGPADYVLFVDRKPVGVIEAKREEEGHRLTVVEEQSKKYADAKLRYINNEPLHFVYESTGIITRFTDYRDPKPRSRAVFHFYQPETFAEWLRNNNTLRKRLQTFPTLDTTGLRPAQIVAIQNLEKSFYNNRPKALIQMATGAGKTFTACTFVYRLLKFANAKRILFLVDTRNLGEQAEQAFRSFQPNDDNRKFTELYNVQRLSSNYIAADSQVCISTIQRLYSILKGEVLEESAELDNPNESSWIAQQAAKKAMPVTYTPEVPIEQFDFIIIDECHRSIYNLWKQVLDYFDAFLIGLTATPDKRTFGFFNENVVSEYTYEESVVDGVNVPYDVYTIETAISKHGEVLEEGWFVDLRDKITRAKRWEQIDQDTSYQKNELDKKVVNISQIRNIIKAYQEALKRTIFPNRIDENGNYEVPKTLVFAKTDSHADDIIQIIREEFNAGNDFCKKVTYKIKEDPKSVLNRFRNDYHPRIAVTVDMIATGTDVKPLEVLLFMRDVKSRNYFEQMKGRGTRTINSDTLQLVSKTAKYKTHFVIVDAVGATKSKKTDSWPLERQRSIPMKDLLHAVMMGAKDQDLFLSLANRLIRLDKQLTDKQKKKVKEYSGGQSLQQISKALLAAHDPDIIADKAQTIIDQIPANEQTPASKKAAMEQAQEDLAETAVEAFNEELNDYLENVRKQHEQIIDHINIDTVTKSEWDTTSIDKAKSIIQDFSDYLAKHKDEIQALRIFYDQPYQRRNITFQMIQAVMEKLKMDKPALAPAHIWDAYAAIETVKSDRPQAELTILVSLIRRVCGIDQELKPYNDTIEKNFNKWLFDQHTGNRNRFDPNQIEWLRMIKNHVVNSFHMDMEDLDYMPFDAKGGRGKMHQLFGDEMNTIINELNEILAA